MTGPHHPDPPATPAAASRSLPIEGAVPPLTGADDASSHRNTRTLRIVPQRLDESAPSRRVARREAGYRHALAIGDVLAATVACVVAIGFVGSGGLEWACVVLVPMLVVMAKVSGLYDRDELLIRKTTIDEIPTIFSLATAYTLLVWLSGSFFVSGGLDRDQAVALLVLLTVGMVLTRGALRRLVAASMPAERCLVIGNEIEYQRLDQRVATSSLPAQIVGRLDLADWTHPPGGDRHRMARLEALRSVIDDLLVDRAIIVFDDEGPEVMLELIRVVKGLGVRVSLLPRVLEVVGSSVAYDDLYGITVMGVRRFGLTRSSALVKRAFDVGVATLASIVVAPLFAVIATLIKLDSPGPVFFRQSRVGRDGEPFPMIKFRSMVDGADRMRSELADRNETDGLFKLAEDPRITRVGSMLRRTSLDELPQVLNVLRGEMSIVGPRPLVLDEDAKVQGSDRRRLSLTPGMTGPWQILGSAEGRVPLGEMVKIDYLYIANWSLWGDVKIVARTIPYVLRRRGV